MRVLHAIFLCCCTLTSGQFFTQPFYSIYEELPERQLNRNPRIITSDHDAIAIMVNKKPDDDQFSISPNDPVEKVPTTPSDEQPITNEVKQNINLLSTILHNNLQFQQVVVLVENNPANLDDARMYLSHLIKNPLLNNQFLLMKFNVSGVSNVLAKMTRSEDKDYENFWRELEGQKDTLSGTKYELGHLEAEHAGVVFFSILKATRLLKFAAAILLFGTGRVLDEDLAQLAIRETQNKQIRILAVWHSTNASDQQAALIREATALTHGIFLTRKTAQRQQNNIQMTINGNSQPVIAHLSNIHGKKEVRMPIEDGVTAIHISMSPSVGRAHLFNPQNYLIDLLNMTDVQRYTRDSYVVRTGDALEIELGMQRHDARDAGVWRLETDAFAQHAYNVVVSVRHALYVRSEFIQRQVSSGTHGNRTDNASGHKRNYHVLHLNVGGDHAKIDDVKLLSSNGEETNQLVKFTIKENTKNSDDIETITAGSDIDIDVQSLPTSPAYIQLRGKDKTGKVFQRISYYDPRNIHNVLLPTTIKLAEGSELYQTPGRASNILFEVTNNRDNVIFMRFTVRDERAYLQRMFPLWSWINPRQTVIVTLTTISKGGSDLLTFTGYSGSERVDKTVIIRSEGSGRMYDVESPHMWHKFTSNCLDVVFSRCQDYSWTMQVTAQDRETGLLLVTSSPDGLHFPNGYTSGTTEEVTGVLSGSCCAPNVVLTAIDAVNNRRSYVANAFWANLGTGAISAIVLGALIALALICLCIYCCVWGKCRRKQKDSLDLPPVQVKYRGPLNSASTSRY